jgi:putative acetyltransferase
VAEIDGEPVGIGAMVVSNSELRACYVAPSAARRGVGSALVADIERIAREHGLDHLQLESSITAEPFYSALGYQVEGRGEHLLSSGVPMAAVKMRKRLD